ncbi:MAG: hypothetical protein IKP40_02000 [Clostridia bacterium]|nr:hypothetical protein [Clostridia bacterium]
MMKHNLNGRRLIALLLSVAMMLQLVSAAFADEGASGEMMGSEYFVLTFVLPGTGETPEETVDTLLVEAGKPLDAFPDAPEREGLSFVGWYMGDTLASLPFFVEGDTKLAARYIDDTLTTVIDDGTEVNIASPDLPEDIQLTATREEGQEQENAFLDWLAEESDFLVKDDPDSLLDGIELDLNELDTERKVLAMFDITLTTAEGEEWQPDENPVRVTVKLGTPLPYSAAAGLSLLHQRADGEIERVRSFSLVEEEGLMTGFTFLADGFSTYAVVDVTLNKTVTTSDGLTYDIQVTYKSTSGIPVEGTQLLVTEILRGNEAYNEYIAASAEAVGVKTDRVEMARVFDIRIVDAADNSIVYEPQGKVDVSIRLVGEALDAYDGLDVLHFVPARSADSYSVQEIAPSIRGESVDFTTDSFSVYVVAGYSLERMIDASDGNTYKITVTFQEDAVLPDDASLKVEELSGEIYEDYLGRAASEMNAGGFAYGRVFDISIVDGKGQEVQPNASVQVSVKLMDATNANDSFSVIHFAEQADESEIAETMASVTHGNTVSFSTDSFSAYAIIQGPDPVSTGWIKITNADELAALNGQGVYIGSTSGYYMKDGYLTSSGRTGITRSTPAATSPDNGAVLYSFELVDGTTNQFYILCTSNNKYLKAVSGSKSLVFADSDADKTAFTVSAESNSRVSISNNGWYVNTKVNNNQAANQRFCIWNENNDDSKVCIWFQEFSGVDPYGLDGQNYGLMNWNGGVTGKAMMAVSSNANNLDAKALTVMYNETDHGDRLYVPNDADITMWSFEWSNSDQYYLKATVGNATKYLKISSSGLSLVDTKDDSCKIKVVPGTGAHAGQVCLKAGNNTLTYSGNFSEGFSITGSAGSEWLYMVTPSELTNEYFRTYSAMEVNSTVPQNNDNVIIYCRVWDETKAAYQFYAVDHEGKLVPCFESGNMIEWVGPQLNNMLWKFTDYLDGQGNPTYYYELKNPYSGNYIAPQVTNGQVFSGSTIGINLNGRRSGSFYTTIVAWDDIKYVYACLKADPALGKIVSINYTDANLTPDAVDFGFAIIQDLPVNDELHTVSTVDHEQYGITMKIIDIETRKEMSDFLGNNDGGIGNVLHQGLLSTYLGDDGYPTNKSGASLGNMYSGARQVNHLFIESTYASSGYFTYDSTQNFATLQADNNFKIYKELGTTDYNTDNKPMSRETLKHGQFFPFDDIEPGLFAETNGENLYSNTAQLLPDSNPRKYERLYHVKNKIPDYYFAMELEANFVQTPDGKDAWGHDIIYEFTGDDDFWLYVDGELIIDLGGIHSAVPGSVNFKTGAVNVNGTNTTLRALFERHYRTSNPGKTDAQVTEYLDGIFKPGTSVFQDDTPHTMRIFYMERGAGASNLKMRFNLASVKPGTVLLSKELAGVESYDSVSAEFPFNIYYTLDPNDESKEVLLGQTYHKIGEPDTNYYYVTHKDNGRPVKFLDELEIDGVTYHNVFLLKPGEVAEIDFNELIGVGEDIYYRIVECGINKNIYGPVTANGDDTIPLFDDTYAVNTSDYGIGYDLTKQRATVEYVNTVKERPRLLIKKRLFTADHQTELFGYDGDNTIFNMRLALGTEYEDETSPTYMYSYHVLDTNLEYCYFDDTIQQFVSYGKTDFSELTSDEKGSATFHSGIWGSITKIPAGFTVEITDVLPGTKFRVNEREDEIPNGYNLWGYTTPDAPPAGYSPNAPALTNVQYADGEIDTEDVLVEVFNEKGISLILNKTWSDADYLENRAPSYFAVFKDDGHGNLTLCSAPDAVRQLPYNTKPQTLYWNYLTLPDGGGLADYVIREVTLSAESPTVTNGVVTNYGTVTPISEYGSLSLAATEKGASAATEFEYTVLYADPYYVENAEGAAPNIRVFDVSNIRAGIIIRKEDWSGNPLSGAKFTLKMTDGNGTVHSSEFTSAETTGIITEAFLRSGVEYTLDETGTPAAYHGLQEPMTIQLENGALQIGYSDSDYYYTETDPDTELPVLVIKDRPYEFEVFKVDAKDQTIPVAGITFALHKERTDGTSTAFPLVPETGYEQLVTGSDGKVPKLDNTLKPGKYQLREIGTIDGYKALTGYIEFTVSDKGAVTLLSAPNGVTLTEDDSGTGAVKYTITIPNEPLGNLVVEKSVTGDSPSGKFPYYVMIQNSNGLWLTEDLTLTDNIEEAYTFEIRKGAALTGKLTLNNIPTGSYHAIELTDGAQLDNYTLEVTYDPAAQDETTDGSGYVDVTTNVTGTIKITNNYTRKLTSIELKKLVDGNMGDRRETNKFKFTVTIKDGNTNLTVTGVTGTAHYLSHGQTVTFSNIPVGATVTITEDKTYGSAALYTTDSKAEATGMTTVTGTNVISFTAVEADDTLVTVNNVYDELINTGIPTSTLPYRLLALLALLGFGALAVGRRKRR